MSGVCQRDIEIKDEDDKLFFIEVQGVQSLLFQVVFVKRLDLIICLFIYSFPSHPQTMAKVITSMLKFSPDEAQKVLDNEDSKTTVSICFPPQDPLMQSPARVKLRSRPNPLPAITSTSNPDPLTYVPPPDLSHVTCHSLKILVLLSSCPPCFRSDHVPILRLSKANICSHHVRAAKPLRADSLLAGFVCI